MSYMYNKGYNPVLAVIVASHIRVRASPQVGPHTVYVFLDNCLRERPLDSQGGAWVFFEKNILALVLAKKNILALTMCEQNILAPSIEKKMSALYP